MGERERSGQRTAVGSTTVALRKIIATTIPQNRVGKIAISVMEKTQLAALETTGVTTM
jgi:hypothetical protein